MQVDTKAINGILDSLDEDKAKVVTKLFNTIKKSLPKGFEAALSIYILKDIIVNPPCSCHLLVWRPRRISLLFIIWVFMQILI
jgi:hypothetical protein